MKRFLRSKLILALMVVALLFGIAATLMVKVPAKAADTGNYPWANATPLDVNHYDWGYSKCPPNDTRCYNLPYPSSKNPTAGMADPWGYGLRNCTSYVAWKINQVFGVNNISGWGNAATWYKGFTKPQTYPVYSPSNYTPQVGDIAQWNSPSPWGHVAYVYAVDPTTHIASLDEYNAGESNQWGNFSSNRTTANTLGNAGTPDHYIHIGTVTPPAPPAPTTPVPWNFEVLDGDPGAVSGFNADVGKNPQSVIYNGGIQMFYYDKEHGTLRHAWNYNAGWNFETLDGIGGANGRIAHNVGAAISVTAYNGTLQLFYYDSTAHTLRHGWSDANGWHFETLDTSGDVGSASTTVVYGTSLQVYYPNLSNGDLRHAWSDAKGWHFENLDGDNGSVAGSQGKSVSNVGTSLTSILDANGNIQLFYYSSTSQGLRHAWADATGWHFENLDGGNRGPNSGTTDSIGQNPSTVMYGSTLQLFSYNASKGALRHDWSDANGWHYENLDGQGSNGPDQYNLGLYSTAVVNGTTLQLFYYDSQWGELRHAWSDANGWHFENLDGLGGLPAGRLGPNMSIGLYPNAVIYNNVPQVFYYDATNGNLRHTWSQ